MVLFIHSLAVRLPLLRRRGVGDGLTMYLLLWIGLATAIIESRDRCNSVTNREACERNSLSFRRGGSIIEGSKHLTISAYSATSDAMQLSIVLLFHLTNHITVQLHNTSVEHVRGASRYHNALFMDVRHHSVFYRMTHDTSYRHNREITLLTRAKRFVMPYNYLLFDGLYKSLAHGAQEWGVASSMHAHPLILSLDRASSIWQQFNRVAIDRTSVVFSYEATGHLSTQAYDYEGVTRLRCRQRHHSECFVQSGFEVNDIHYPRMRLYIDLNSHHSYLPTSLYFPWLEATGLKRHVLINVSIEQQRGLLHLNSLFRYELNTHSEDIVLGLDLVRLFSRVEYSYAADEFHLWHHPRHTHTESYTAITIFFDILVPVVLFMMGMWLISRNHQLYHFLILYSDVTLRHFFFSFKIVFVEMLAVVLAVTVVILSFVFANADAYHAFHNRNSAHYQRNILFTIIVLGNSLMLVVAFVGNLQPLKMAWRYYTRRADKRQNTLDTNSHDYAVLRGEYLSGEEKKLVRLPTSQVLVRNLALGVLLLSLLLMLLNFQTEEQRMFRFYVLFVALILMFYWTYYLYMMVLFAAPGVNFWTTNPLFTLFYIAELALYLLYMGWSVECIYADYFRGVNGLYAEPVLYGFVFILLALLAVVSIYIIAYRFEHYIKKHYW